MSADTERLAAARLLPSTRRALLARELENDVVILPGYSTPAPSTR
ncbi:hypothetical protein [Cryptosporangium sp. NPDC051539]